MKTADFINRFRYDPTKVGRKLQKVRDAGIADSHVNHYKCYHCYSDGVELFNGIGLFAAQYCDKCEHISEIEKIKGGIRVKVFESK